MSKNLLMGVLVIAVVALAVAAGWMWSERQDADVTIDLPEMHLRK